MISDPAKARFSSIWQRRIISFSLYTILWALIFLTLPLILATTIVLDLLKPLNGHGARTRCILFFFLFLNCEILGLVAALILWAASGTWIGIGRRFFVQSNYELQSLWARALLKGAMAIFSMSLQEKNAECAVPWPIILMIRHASTADTVLASVLVASRFKMRLRFVLKQELLWDPCLDVVGNRIPNVFVERSGNNTERELAIIKSLSQGMSESDGILIYPEGTRFSKAKLSRIRKKMRKKAPPETLALVEGFQQVLPPRLGGISAIVETAPEADLVICAHTGFEGAANFKEFWRGALIGKTVKVSFWRIPCREVPQNHQERKVWLMEHWSEVDQWVHTNLS